MTFSELVLLAAGGVGIYLLLRPLQRWLDRSLQRIFSRRRRRFRGYIIDATDVTPVSQKEDHEHRS